MAAWHRALFPVAVAIALISSIIILYITLDKADSIHDHLDYQSATAEKFPLHIDAKFSALPIASEASQTNPTFLIQNEFIYPERHCEFCTHFIQNFTAQNKNNIAYVAPSSSYNMAGAKRITFFAMGDQGGERIRFMVGAKNSTLVSNFNSSNANTTAQINSIADNFAIKTDYIQLTRNWKKYQIDISYINLDSNSVPFALQVGRVGGQNTSDFYVKDISYDAKFAINSLN